MSEKKVVGRRLFIALEIVCVILVACLVGATSLYSLQINDRDNTISSLNSQISQLDANVTNLQNQDNQLQTWLDGNKTLLNQTQTWLDGNKILLNQTQTWLDGNITYYSSQITNLQNQLSNFTEPILGFSDLTAEDNRTIPDTPCLQIEGTIHNFGIAGTLATLYVQAYHNDGSLALKTELIPNSTYQLLSIGGQSSIKLNLNYYYSGSALASWTIAVEQVIVI